MSMMRAGHCFRFGIQMITPNWAIIWRLMPPVASSIISLYRHFDPRIVQTSQNKRGRGITHGTHKSLVVGAVGVIPYVDKKGDARERAGRLRLAVIQNADEETIGSFLNKNV